MPSHSSRCRMGSFASLTTLALALLPSMSFATKVSHDAKYDNAGNSLSTVACSDGPNGLMTRGFTTFGSLPKFPHIGGGYVVEGWNSPNCGTCWELTYTNPQGKKKSINVLAIDVAKPGFNIASSAVNELTNGNAEQFGIIDVTSKSVDPSVCGLKV